MKHLITISLLTSALFLSGCAANNANHQASSQTENSTTATTPSEEHPDRKEQTKVIDSPQAPDDSSLTKVGQSYQDADGSITLKAKSDYHEKLMVGDMALTVSDVKVMSYSPSPDLIDFFHGYSNDETTFNYVKIRVNVKNTSDQTVNFAPVSALKTSDGEKKGFDDDFYLENLYGDYEAGEERIGQLGFVLNTTDLGNLESMTIHTSDVFDPTGETLTKGKAITVPF